MLDSYMTPSEYNQHVTRCAQLVLGLVGGDKSAAQTTVPVALSGLRGRFVGSTADSIDILRLTANPHAGDNLTSIADAAWAAHLADIRARILTLP